MGANSSYWDVFGSEMPEQWDEIIRVSLWAKTFQEQAGLQQEEAKELSESLVTNAAQSEVHTLIIDTVLHHLLEPVNSLEDNVELATAFYEFFWLMADTFYSRHAIESPSLGIKPKEPQIYREVLSQYIRVAWWLGFHIGISEEQPSSA